MHTQKNYTLEAIKLFASYMVVFIHVMFYGKVGDAVNALARFAVPLFFLISGYYSFQIQPDKYKKRIRNILGLWVLGVVCYTLFHVAVSLSNGSGIAAHFGRYLNVGTLIKIFALNVSVASGHLWYLSAILYVYVVFYLVTVFRINEKVVFAVSFLLLILQLLLGEGLSACGVVVPMPLVRNFALLGIPFFALGLLTRKYESKLRNVSNYLLVPLAAIGVLATLLSRWWIGINEVYIGSLFILFVLVVVFVKYAAAPCPACLRALSGCSTYIYIFHVMISLVIIKAYEVLHIDFASSVFLNYAHPIIVCIASTIFAYVLIQLTNALSSKKQK